MKDLFGNELKNGDFLAYAMRKGNSSEIAVGRVLEVLPLGVKVKSVRPLWTGKFHYTASTWRNPLNAVRIDAAQIPADIRSELEWA